MDGFTAACFYSVVYNPHKCEPSQPSLGQLPCLHTMHGVDWCTLDITFRLCIYSNSACTFGMWWNWHISGNRQGKWFGTWLQLYVIFVPRPLKSEGISVEKWPYQFESHPIELSGINLLLLSSLIDCVLDCKQHRCLMSRICFCMTLSGKNTNDIQGVLVGPS